MRTSALFICGVLLLSSVSFAQENVGQQITQIENKNISKDQASVSMSQETLYRSFEIYKSSQSITRYNIGYTFATSSKMNLDIGAEYVASELESGFQKEKVVGLSHLQFAFKRSFLESEPGAHLNYGIESKVALSAARTSATRSIDESPRFTANNSLGYSQISPYLGLVYNLRSTTITARYIYSADSRLQKDTNERMDYSFWAPEYHLEASFEVDVIRNLAVGVLGSLGGDQFAFYPITSTNDRTESFSKLYANYKVDQNTIAGLNLYSANETIPDQYHSSGVGLSFSRSIE